MTVCSFAHHDGEMASLTEDVDPEARFIVKRITAIAGSFDQVGAQIKRRLPWMRARANCSVW